MRLTRIQHNNNWLNNSNSLHLIIVIRILPLIPINSTTLKVFLSRMVPSLSDSRQLEATVTTLITLVSHLLTLHQDNTRIRLHKYHNMVNSSRHQEWLHRILLIRISQLVLITMHHSIIEWSSSEAMGRIVISLISSLLSHSKDNNNSSSTIGITIMQVNLLVISTQQKYSNLTTTSAITAPPVKAITLKDNNNSRNNNNNLLLAVIVAAVIVMLCHSHRVLQQSALSINTSLIAIVFHKSVWNQEQCSLISNINLHRLLLNRLV